MSKKTLPKCVKCQKNFDWKDAFLTQYTPGSEPYNPPGTGVYRPRLYCPRCGALVVDWHITSEFDYDDWIWFDDNATVNVQCSLPPKPSWRFYKSIPRHLIPMYEEHRLDIERINVSQVGRPKKVLSQDTRKKKWKRLFDEALRLAEAGKIQDCLLLFKKAIIIGLPRREQAQVQGAIGINLLNENKDVESAFKHLLISTKLDSTAYWKARFYLGLIYYAKGQVDKAETEYREARRLAGYEVIEPDTQQRAVEIVQRWTKEIQRRRRRLSSKTLQFYQSTVTRRRTGKLLQMSQKGKTFRVFVSSTFEDLHIERNVLQERVFPRLRALCKIHGTRFQAIDLRWGVSDQASVDQQTMPMCLREIERCQKLTPRPNFIVLLGDRYGWRPLPATIPAAEYEAIIEWVTSKKERKLLTTWYRCDDNALPPVYVLKPRRKFDNSEDQTEEEQQKTWNQTEKRLRRIFLGAISNLQLTEEQRIKYIASACEQEIVTGVFKVMDAHEHVYAFMRKIRGLPQDKRARPFLDVDENGLLDREARSDLERLKIRLSNYLSGNVYSYQSDWVDGTITQYHLEQLCEDAYRALEGVILKELARMRKVDPIQEEQAAHAAFGRERIHNFVGRSSLLKAIGEYLQEVNRHPLVVYGPPGSGKTALIAKAIAEAQSVHSNAIIITRFIGATAESSEDFLLLEGLCRQISRAYRVNESTIPSDYKSLIKVFNEQLSLATPNKKLFIFIDALDQLYQRNPVRNLSWFPPELPANVRLVVTSLPGECLTVLQSKVSASNIVELELMAVSEAQVLLDLWLKEAERTLQEEQRSVVLRGFESCKLPLYLRLAFEEARKWRSYDSPANLSSDIPGIIRNLFARFSLEVNHGKLLTTRSLSYLAAAKNGLAEDEMIDVLTADQEIMIDFRRRFPKSPEVNKLPVAVWSRLYFDLEPYLTTLNSDGTSLLCFYHRELCEVVESDFLVDGNRKKCHIALARYFANQPLHVGKEQFPNLRKLSELPYQQAHGQKWNDLEATLTDLEFLYSKICATNPHFLIEDYEEAFQTGFKSETLELIVKEIKRSAHILGVDPNQIAGQIVNRLMFSNLTNVQKLVEQARKWNDAPWLCPLMPSVTPPSAPLLSTLAGHKDGIGRLALTPDGRKVVSASLDRTLKVWDLENGEELQTLIGHTDAVTAVAITPDGRWAISGSKDRTLKVWDLKRGLNLATLTGHTDLIETVAVTPDGRRAISGSWDKTLKIWDLDSHKQLRTLTGHTDKVEAVTVTPDGRSALSASIDKTLKIWEINHGRELCTLVGHTDGVTSVTVTPDGCHAISASLDRTLKIWDLRGGNEIATLTGHNEGVVAVAVTPDGRRVVSGSRDQTLKIWDLNQRVELATFAGHLLWVWAVAVTPDGRWVVSASGDFKIKVWDLSIKDEATIQAMTAIAVTSNGQRAVSGSRDQTLKIWDLEKKAEIATLAGHTDTVCTVALTPDDRHAISGSLDRTLKLWDLERGKELLEMTGHKGAVWSVAVTPNGRFAISGSKDRTLKVWDILTGQELMILSGHDDWVRAVAITPDGKRIISGSKDRTLKIWDLEKGTELATLTGHTDAVWAVTVTPDGRRAISGSFDRTLKIWDLERCKEVRTLIDQAYIFTVAATPDALRVISGSHDGEVTVWDINTGEPIATFTDDQGILDCAALPDGMSFVACGSSGHLQYLQLKGV